MRAKLFGVMPGMRWVPSDISSASSSKSNEKEKPRYTFALRAAQPEHAVVARSRKSAISLTSNPDTEVDARTHAQVQAMFFARLPAEIRMEVYRYLMDEETVHLTLGAKKKFGHFVCGEGDRHGRECSCRVLVGGGSSARLDAACLSLMRTCRRIYSEAIPLLYRPHIFSLLHLTHLLYLPTRIPSHRLDSIRNLRLRWAIRGLPYLRRGTRRHDNPLAYREDTANWERGWSIIARMAGLRDLHVVLVDPSPQQMWEPSWLQLEEQLLAPISEVTKPWWGEVVLPYGSCETLRDMGDSRIVLRRPMGEEGMDG